MSVNCLLEGAWATADEAAWELVSRSYGPFDATTPYHDHYEELYCAGKTRLVAKLQAHRTLYVAVNSTSCWPASTLQALLESCISRWSLWPIYS